MKYLIFLLAEIFSLSIISYSQTRTFADEIVKLPDVVVKQPLNYNSIKIIDARLDTTKIGYIGRKKEYKKIVTEGPLSSVLQKHLNSQLQKQLNITAGQSIIIIVKKLWLQQTNTEKLQGKKISGNISPDVAYYGMSISGFDIYIQKENYYIPLLKIDTTLLSPKNFFDNTDYLLGLALENCLNQIGLINPNKSNRRSLSWAEIEQYNNRRLAYPRYTNDSLIEGVFMTFKDFLYNKPLKKKFVVQSGELTDELYIEQNGQALFLDNFWGFCDGKKNYIHVGLNFFEITKEMNTYELWGSKLITERTRHNVGVGSLFSALGARTNPGTTKKAKLYYEPLQLNMETGKVY